MEKLKTAGIDIEGWIMEEEQRTPGFAERVEEQRAKLADPSCHACGSPIELGEPVAVYHEGCEGNRLAALEAERDEIRAALGLMAGGTGHTLAQEVKRVVEENAALRDQERKAVEATVEFMAHKDLNPWQRDVIKTAAFRRRPFRRP